MSQLPIQRESVSLLAIARAIVAGCVPGLQVVCHQPELRKAPVEYQGQRLQRGLGRQFRLLLASKEGQHLWLLDVEGISGLFEVETLTPDAQARQQADEKAALEQAPYLLGIGERRFPVADVQQAVEWSTFLIGYLPRFPQGFILDTDFLSRDYASIARQMERDQICPLHGIQGVAYLLPGTGLRTYALYYQPNAAPADADPDALLALVSASSPAQAEQAGCELGQVVATLFDE